ncbi:MAG: long-chain fatty acid--CoA ligase [Bacteroidota bacterium]|nr:long-chain fatty acid--CoA ligase [Bacteroidota bacterium]
MDLFSNEYRAIPDVFNIKREGVWIHYSASDYVEYSRNISLGLLSMGIKKGTRVATIMKNCPEWNFFDMGLMQIGAVQVPIYPTISEDNYRYIFNDSQVEFLIISDEEIYSRIKDIIPEFPFIKNVFCIEEVKGVSSWKDILESGKKNDDSEELDRIMKSIQPEDMATIIYTSGTTGKPKGVMLSHRNFVTNFQALAEIPPLQEGDRIISALPLCHVYERTAGYAYQSFGTSIFYVQDLHELISVICEIRPHAFASVPRILEKIYNGIVNEGRNLPRYRKMIFFWALRQGHKFDFDKNIYYRIKLWIANMLIFSKWRKALGGRIKFISSGSASLHPRLSRIFWAAKIPILEAYGLTETSPAVSIFHFCPGGVRFGTVGMLLRDIQVKIAEDGEILCKGPNVMMGYYNRPERTREVIDEEGWFHTGDIGVMEEGKYLRITDRKKEIFKTSTGKYIAPQVIEQKFKESPFIEHIIVLGENRKYTSALIIPNFEYLRAWCNIKKIPFISPYHAVENPEIVHRLQKEVDFFNQILGQTEKIKKFRLLTDEWTVESGELSPTLKLRRKFIQEKYKQIIEENYHSSDLNYKQDFT